jgi:type IV pilus assembly protein PilC
MPNFIYTAKDLSGKMIKESASSANKDALIAPLQGQGYFVLNIEESESTASFQKTQTSKAQKRFKRKKINAQDTLLFSRQLATMLESGVNLFKSLNVIVNQVESENFHKVLAEIRDDVEQGASLSVSLAKHPKVFNPLWVSLTEVGEASGTMPLVLNKLADYVEKADAFRTAIISALIYPALLFCVAIGAILFFALVIGPKFQEMYSSMSLKLPVLTQTLLNVFTFVRSQILVITAAICAIFILGKRYIDTPIGRLQLEKLIFKIPVLGEMVRTAIMERFASQMSILVESGVPILYALDIIERLIGNKTCAAIVAQIKIGVREGKLISDEMMKTDFFPPMAAQMIAIGEETGELGKMLNHIAEYYQRALQTFTARFASIFEPIVLIFMGVTIGTMVLAMFLPIFNLSSGGG